MKAVSKLIASFFMLLAALLGSVELSAQTNQGQLHAQSNLDLLKNMSSKSTLLAAEMQQVRAAMLAINNEARSNPNYRRAQGSQTALQLPSNLEPIKLNDELNKIAQEQAEYQAKIRDVTHDNANYKSVNNDKGYGERAGKYLPGHVKLEACGGSSDLADYPIGWMKSETHYRPTWSLEGVPINAVGFGAAKSGDTWYTTAMWSYVADPAVIQKANKDNLAFGKPARQSSDLDACYAGAGKAVDGNTDANLKMNDAKSSVSHTGDEESPWWEVDLGAVYDIGKVVVWNRQDCCWDRLQNFVVSTSGQ